MSNELSTEIDNTWLKRQLTIESSDGTWLPPRITPEVQAQARSMVAVYDRQAAIATEDTIRKWLAALGASCAALPAAEANARLNQLTMLIGGDFPAGCFTKASLERAASSFTFFPTWAQLKPLLTDEARRCPSNLVRVKALASGQTAQATTRPKPSDEDQAYITHRLGETVAHLRNARWKSI